MCEVINKLFLGKLATEPMALEGKWIILQHVLLYYHLGA